MPAGKLTLNEAGYVVRRPRKEINRAIDTGLITASVVRRGRTKIRAIGENDLRFLVIEEAVAKDVTPAGRKKIYRAIKRTPLGTDQVEVGIMRVRLKETDRFVEEGLRRLKSLQDMVEERENSAVIRGTEIPVHTLAALVGGQGEEVVLKHFPDINKKQLRAAVDYAQIYPKAGRSHPEKFNEALRELASAGVWDLDSEDIEEVAEFEEA